MAQNGQLVTPGLKNSEKKEFFGTSDDTRDGENPHNDIVVVDLPPRAAAMIEAMRDIDYSLESAIADIVDNSITAKASKIDIRCKPHIYK